MYSSQPVQVALLPNRTSLSDGKKLVVRRLLPNPHATFFDSFLGMRSNVNR